MPATRFVICTARCSDGPFELPASQVLEEPFFITGGQRSLYELGVAMAALGVEVELRGPINGAILRELTSAARATPTVELPPRRPDRDDVIVLPGAAELELLSTVALSHSKLVMYLLGPPGLWGWSFLPGWERPDPYSVAPTSLARPETFRAMRDFGFTLWTNAHGIAAAGRRADVEIEWIGTGTPVRFPAQPPKTFDVAVVEHNRWAQSAQRVLDRLDGVTVKRIPATPSTYSLSAALAPARILVWPSRIEGMSRIQREARGVGTVPVALNTNPFVTAEDHSEGVVFADDLDGIAREIRSLLADEERLAQLAGAGVRSAAQQVEWNAFVGRVSAAIEQLEAASPSGSPVMEVLGERSWRRARAIEQEHLERLQDSIARLEQRSREIVSLESARRSLSEDLQRHQGWLTGIQGSWSWRLTEPLRRAKRAARATRRTRARA